MNRRQFAALGFAAAVALTGLVGAIGAMELSTPDDTETPAGTSSPADVEETRVLDDALPLVTGDGQVVRGETPLDAGTELTVRLVSNGESPFVRSADTTVDDDGTFAATFDLSSVEPGNEARLVVLSDDQGELVNRTVTIETGQGANESDEETPTDGTTVDHDGDSLTLANATDQAVTGTADVAAGSELTVRLRSSDSQQPFVMQTTTTAGDDGRFEATFDLSQVDPGATFTVVVLQDGEELTELDGEIVEE